MSLQRRVYNVAQKAAALGRKYAPSAIARRIVHSRNKTIVKAVSKVPRKKIQKVWGKTIGDDLVRRTAGLATEWGARKSPALRKAYEGRDVGEYSRAKDPKSKLPDQSDARMAGYYYGKGLRVVRHVKKGWRQLKQLEGFGRAAWNTAQVYQALRHGKPRPKQRQAAGVKSWNTRRANAAKAARAAKTP